MPCVYENNVNREVQRVLQLQTAANPETKRNRKMTKKKLTPAKQTNKQRHETYRNDCKVHTLALEIITLLKEWTERRFRVMKL